MPFRSSVAGLAFTLALSTLALAASPALAQRLPTAVRPDHYDLAFDVDLAAARFDGTETIRVRIDRGTSRVVLHALDIDFREVAIRQAGRTQRATVTLDESTETATLTVPAALSAGTADIHIRYAGTLNNQLRGFYLSHANGRRYAVTQLEATDARRAFPSFDEPALKATFAVSLTVDQNDTAISNSQDASCTELSGAAMDFSETTCPAWVFLNAGARGYYRTAYPPTMLAALSSDLATKLTPPERLSLAGDEWALVRAGRHSVADYLTLAAGFGAEQSSGVLDEVVTRLAFIHDYIASEGQRPRFEAFVRSVLRPLFDRLGLTPRSGESDETRALRAVVIDALGHTGNDAEVLSAARAYVDRALAGEASLDPTLASTVLRLAARRGNRALFDSLSAAARKADTPEEHYRYVNAVSAFEDPALVQLGLERLLTDEIRTQDAEAYLRGFLSNPNSNVNRLAWSFVKQHADAVLSKVSISFGDARMVGSLVSFCDAATRDDIKNFFTRNARPAAARALELTVERIDNCIDLKSRQEQVLSRWLERRTP